MTTARRRIAFFDVDDTLITIKSMFRFLRFDILASGRPLSDYEAAMGQLDALKAERANWERRVSLLKSESIDPDMLDERARVLLNYADPRELTLRFKQP